MEWLFQESIGQFCSGAQYIIIVIANNHYLLIYCFIYSNVRTQDLHSRSDLGY